MSRRVDGCYGCEALLNCPRHAHACSEAPAADEGDGAATTQDEDISHGLTFAAWLRRAGGYEHVIEQGVDARVAWRAGEDPAEYAMQEAS